jgi:outer membrane protein assembly factor BamE
MRLARLLPGVLAAALTGCLTVYVPNVQQGNALNQEMLDKVKPGMTKAQVRFALGTPLLSDTFHPERWDYYYSFRKGSSTEVERRLITVIFDQDVLARIEGDVVTAAPPAVAPSP